MGERKILFPTDFSPANQSALEYATALARDRKAKLVIAHVEEPPLAYGAGEAYVGPLATEAVDLKGMLERVLPTDPSVPYAHRLLLGDPASEIVRLADEEGVEMIVLATHGRSGLVRFLMGSVAEAVVRRANCPVLSIKAPHTSNP